MSTQIHLDEARAALHKLITGRSAISVTHRDGRRVEYTQANRRDLESYISSLEKSLGQSTRRRGPAGVTV